MLYLVSSFNRRSSPGAAWRGVSVPERSTGFLFRFDKYKILASKKAWVDIWEGGRFFVIAVCNS